MSSFEPFKGIDDYFMKNADDFKTIFESNSPHKVSLPWEWNKKLNSFEKIIFLKAIRPDKVLPALKLWINNNIG